MSLDREQLRVEAGELVDEVWREASGEARPGEQVRLRGAAYDLATRLFLSGRLAVQPPVGVVSRIIADGMKAGTSADDIARHVRELRAYTTF